MKRLNSASNHIAELECGNWLELHLVGKEEKTEEDRKNRK